MEASAVDIEGRPYGFHVLQNTMLSKRALHGSVTVGRFVYAVGGTDGAQALTSVERAYVLSPEERPRVTSVSLELNESEGLGQGTWSYRVAGVMAADESVQPRWRVAPL